MKIESVPYYDESEGHCPKRVMVAMWIFAGLLVILSAAAVCLLWSKI